MGLPIAIKDMPDGTTKDIKTLVVNGKNNTSKYIK